MENITPCTRKPIPHGDLPMRQRALVETLLAYYYRGHGVQYDSVLLTVQEKYSGGDLRETDFCSPEMATEDSFMYAVCSSYPWEALYDAFGYRMEGSPLNFKSFKIVHTPADNPILAYRYYEHGEKEELEGPVPNHEQRKAAAKALYEMLQVGDIIVTDRKTGHTMVYMGDFLGDGSNYLLHCAGKKYNMETAEDAVEYGRGNDTGGAIRIDKAEYFFFGEKTPSSGPMWPISTHPRMVVLRPLQAMDEREYPISAAAMTRLRYPRISYDRRASFNRFTSVCAGDKVTLTVTVKNNAPSDYMEPVTVTEQVPHGCRLLPASVTGGGKVCGGVITWEKTLKKGQPAVLSYTVEVTSPRGSTVVFDGGSCGTIPSNAITLQVAGKGLTDAQKETMAALEEGHPLPEGSFAQAFYREILGLDPKLPTLAEVEKHLFTLGQEPDAPKKMLHLTKNTKKDFELQAKMLVPGWFGGMEVKAAYDRRILTTTEKFCQPGDVILSAPGEKDFGLPEKLIYLGCGRLAAPGDEGIRILDAKELDKLLPSRLFVCLRPTLAYEDIHAEAQVAETVMDFSQIPDGPEKEELMKKYQSAAQSEARESARAAARKEFAFRQQAVVETALAYYRKGFALQYDSQELVNAESRDGIGVGRTTPYRSPEDSTWQDPGYFVCSSFTYQVYKEAFGHDICADADHCACSYQLKTGDSSVVYHWFEDSGESKEEAIETVRRLLQPGDILTTRKKTAHSMLFLGDVKGDGRDYIIHSWGKKYNMTTGKDAYEEKGTITLQPVEELCFVDGHKEYYKENRIPRWSLFDDQREIIVLRPLRAISGPPSENALARLRNPGLCINRFCSLYKYQDARVGEEVTVRIQIRNMAATPLPALPVTELLPENAQLVYTDGRQEGHTVRWLLELPAGGSRTVKYRVKVTGGDSITFTGGNVGGIRSNTIVRRILPEGMTVPEDIPAFIRGILREVKDAPGQEGPLVELAEKPAVLVPGYWGGRMLTERQRILEFDVFQPVEGDVLVVAADPLGENAKFETYVWGKDLTVKDHDFLWSLFVKDFFCLLRA